jgi:mycoredoxin
MTDKTIVMYTTRWCPDCRRAKMTFERMGVTFTNIDVESDENARKLVMAMNHGNCSVPTIMFPDGSHLTEPNTHILEQALLSYTNK